MGKHTTLVVVVLIALVAGFVLDLASNVVSGQGDPDGAFIVLYPDGRWEYAQEPPSATTGSPQTPLYSTDVPTYTPTAETTPTATWTPPPTATVAVETPAPTVTPAPTLPPPDELVCMAGVGLYTLRIRADHTTASAIVGALSQSERVEVLSIYIVRGEGSPDREEWARINGGWIALWHNGVELAVLDDAPPCWEIPITYATAWGVWSGPGASQDETAQFIRDLQAAGITPAVTVYGDQDMGRIAHAMGAYVLARPFVGDHPPFTQPARDSARAWVDRALGDLGAGWYDCLVLSNEPVHPTYVYARDWIAAAVERAAEREVGCIVPVVWSTGHPALAAVELLRPAYESETVTVYWGLNLYPANPLKLLSDREAGRWTTYRWEMYDPPGDGVVVTEFARGDGAQVAEMSDIEAFVGYADGAFVAATAWYNAGPSGLGIWGDAVLWGRLGALGRVWQ